MFRSILIIAVLTMKLISCVGHAGEEDTDKPLADEVSQFDKLRALFRFSKGSFMLSNRYGIPYQYYVPRIDPILDDLNDGYIKVPSKVHSVPKVKQKSEPSGSNGPVGRRVHSNDKHGWRLTKDTRSLTPLELLNADSWKRKQVPLNRLMMSLDSPIFLSNFFYALTSLTEVNGTKILSRFYYAPVLTAKYGRKHNDSKELIVKDPELSIFSVCIEPSDAFEEASIPLLRRPQQIIDAGLRSNYQNIVYDVGGKLRENTTEKFKIAEKHFANKNWDAFSRDPKQMAFKQSPQVNSTHETIKTPSGYYYNDHLAGKCVAQTAFHGYDTDNDAYVFAYGPGTRLKFSYTDGDASTLLVFLNPRTHIEDETKLWDMCVDLWRQEMYARYGTDANSHLVCPHAYLDEHASTAPYYGMIPRHDTLGMMGNQAPMVDVGELGKPLKRASEDIRSDLKVQRAPNKPEEATCSGELTGSKPLSREYSFVGAVQRRSEPINTKNLTDGVFPSASELENSGVLPESSACCSRNLDGSRVSDLPINGSHTYANVPGYWASGLPCTAGFGNMGVHGNLPAFNLPPTAPVLCGLPRPQALYSNPLTTGPPFGLFGSGPTLPLFTQPLQFDGAIEAANLPVSMQPASLGMGAGTLAIQQQANSAALAQIVSLLQHTDLAIWNNPAFFSRLANPTTLDDQLNRLAALDNQHNRQ